MLGLVLQGGGAKGAYQAGAIKALDEEGLSFNAVCGTSIGAINGALVAQGDSGNIFNIWQNVSVDTVFDMSIEEDNKTLSKTMYSAIKPLIYSLKNLFTDSGLDMEKSVDFITQHISEDKIRTSSIDYGLTTVSLNERRALQLFKQDIPLGKLIDYILASANYPLFKRRYIEDKPFIDGGFYDNLPINMLIEKGYKDIIAITLGNTFAPIKKVTDTTANISYIRPSEKLGAPLDFRNSAIKRYLKIGYLDAKKHLNLYTGCDFYIKNQSDVYAMDLFLSLDDSVFIEISKILGVNDITVFDKSNDMVKVIDPLFILFDIDNKRSMFFLLMLMTESIARLCSVDRLRSYTLKELITEAYNCYICKDYTLKISNIILPTSRKQLEISQLVIKGLINKI